MESQVSIIMPVYNTFNFVERALTSVVGQTYSNWELLIINDGSTDKSPEIIEEWSRKDERVRVFHQQNAGVSRARNKGLSYARGKFICFLDSDDWLPRSEEHTSELQSRENLVCRLLLEKKKAK